MKTDSQLQADVLEELRADASLAPTTIAVAAKDGVVTLAGEVDSLAKRSAARRAAERVHGVRGLADEIVVHLPLDHRRSDADLAHDAVHALMWDTDVPDKTVKVRVQDRWLWLVGEADWQFQRDAAEHAVANIVGLRGVTNLVRLKKRAASSELVSGIEKAIARNASLAGCSVTVTLEGDVVRLTGAVRSWSQRMSAEHAAWSAPGVTDVDNQLTVSGEGDGAVQERP